MIIGCLPIVYLLLRLLIGRTQAAVALLFLLLGPYLAAHSRVLHHDALVAIFMLMAALVLAIYRLRGHHFSTLLGAHPTSSFSTVADCYPSLTHSTGKSYPHAWAGLCMDLPNA